jgi:hypothetical protein
MDRDVDDPPVEVGVHPLACTVPLLTLPLNAVQTMVVAAPASVANPTVASPEAGMASAAANIKMRRMRFPFFICSVTAG